MYISSHFEGAKVRSFFWLSKSFAIFFVFMVSFLNTPKENNITPRVFSNTPFLFSDKARLFDNYRSLMQVDLNKKLQSLSVLQPFNYICIILFHVSNRYAS